MGLAKEGTPPVLMTRAELLSYVTMLEQKCEFLNAEVRKTEGNAVMCIAAMTLIAGGEVVITPADIERVKPMQFARSMRTEDNAAIFRVREKPPEVVAEEAAAAAQPFTPDGL